MHPPGAGKFTSLRVFCKKLREELSPLVDAKIGDDPFEVVVEHIKAAVELVDGEITGEHTAVRPEDLDGLQYKRADAVFRPAPVHHAETRNLHPDIRLRREPAYAGSPEREGVGVAIDRHASMIEDDGGVAMRRGKRRGVRHLRRIELQVEREIVAFQQGEAAQPCRVGEEIWFRHIGLGRIWMPIHNVADAAHVRKLAMSGERRFDIGPMQLGPRNDAMRKSALIGNRLQPARLPHRLRRIEAGVDMHGFDDVLVGCVCKIVVEQIGFGDRRDVAGYACRQGPRAQPRIGEAFEIPEMVVRIDNWEIVHLIILRRPSIRARGYRRDRAAPPRRSRGHK